MGQHSIDKNKAVLSDVLLGCPMGRALDNCPARELRAIPIERRMIAIDTMGPDRIEEIVVYHAKCLEEREGC